MPGATVSTDPHIPLIVEWQFELWGDALYLSVTGDEGGFLELTVDSHSGALYRLVLLNVPPFTPSTC